VTVGPPSDFLLDRFAYLQRGSWYGDLDPAAKKRVDAQVIACRELDDLPGELRARFDEALAEWNAHGAEPLGWTPGSVLPSWDEDDAAAGQDAADARAQARSGEGWAGL
jgi:hypothetical protein